MAMGRDEIFDMLITELREQILLDFREIAKTKQNRYSRISDIKHEMDKILSQLGEEKKATAENYLAEKDNLIGEEFDYLYLQGIKDGIRLLRVFSII